MDNEQSINTALDLGTWLGRKQAFGAMAGRCSAADAECLRKMREDKQYRALGMNWEEFCKQKIGMTRPTADRIIRNLDEFGPKYFELAAVLRIAAEPYRQIASAVTEGGVVCNGETIEISVENAPRLAQAVESLRGAVPAREAAPPSQSLSTTLRRGRKAFGDALECYSRALREAEFDAERDLIRREMANQRLLLELKMR
jgi:hypothetical protein